MSVVINTNTAATIASNNLASANDKLKTSLNRLSSGSRIVNGSDDAGGIAVATRLSAGVKRAAAANMGIGNALSFLQNQDSGLKTLSKVATRMNELQMLYRDSSLGTSDKTNYETEFLKLRARYEDIRTNLKYNGKGLLDGSGNLSVSVNEAGTVYTLSDIGASATDGAVKNLSSAQITDGSDFATVTGGTAFSAGAAGKTTVVLNNVTVTVTAEGGLAQIISDLNSASSQTRVIASADSTGTKLVLRALYGGESLKIAAGDISLSDWGLTAGSTSASSATDLSKLAIDSLSGARAKNGADQSSLGYYAELGQATISNFESAISRIVDVDVASESTQLARWTTLVQAGTAMLAQANGSTVAALSLLKG
jgi:flagellin